MYIKVDSLSKKFNNFQAVDNINFNLDKNKTLGLLGPNGCGKTTSIGMMLGLITPSSGTVLIDGENINGSKQIDLLILGWSQLKRVSLILFPVGRSSGSS